MISTDIALPCLAKSLMSIIELVFKLFIEFFLMFAPKREKNEEQLPHKLDGRLSVNGRSTIGQ